MAFTFGTPAAAPSQPAAGSSGTSGFSFGQTPAQQQQNKPATGGFSFGNTAASQPATSGAAPATSTGGGLFGGFGSSQPAAAPAASSTTSGGGLFSFGAKPAATSQPQQPAGSTSTFGSTTNTASGGLFGSSTTQPSSTGAGFSFGASTNNTQQQQQQPQQQTTSLFGAPASSFSTTSSAQQPVAQTQFSVQPSRPQAPSAQPDKKLGPSLSTKLEQIRAAWDTCNASGCRFAYYFYNNAGNSQNLKLIQGRRPDAVGPMHDQLWAAAVRENPDPNRLYPVLALGFNDLKKPQSLKFG
ncbi:hypothetical protein NDA16_004353 [Ustilago loliicola]|nr:hypothetical protein NDA16_004353 [Ustilago loliicola]